MKKTITISVEVEVFEKFSKIVDNVSKNINDYMACFISVGNNEENLSLELLNFEIEKKTKELNKLTSELNLNRQKKDIIMTQQEENEKNKIIKEQQEELKLKKCVVCGRLVDPKFIRVVPAGICCKSCNLDNSDEVVIKKGYKIGART